MAMSTIKPQAPVEQTLFKQFTSVFAPLVMRIARHHSVIQGNNAMHDRTESTSNRVVAQATDFSRWLFQNTLEDDHIAVHMDVAGAEFNVMEQLVRDGSMLLIDDLTVVWHDELRPALAGWPEALEHMAEKLGTRISSNANLLQATI